MDKKDLTDQQKKDLNADPITGSPGAHPVGTGVGAAGAGAAGAAIGAVAGPVGSLVGAGIGAVVGGLIGKGVAEGIDPTVETAYWRENYSNRPYVASNADKGYTFENDYEPAYRYGVDTRKQYHDKRWDDVESDLERDWHTRGRSSSRMEWGDAKHAVRDAWHRIEERIPGDADNDGR